MDEMTYKGPELMVRLREAGERRHVLLGSGSLVNRKVHAARFLFQPEAIDTIRWMFDHNPGVFDSGQVVKGGRTVATVSPSGDIHWGGDK